MSLPKLIQNSVEDTLSCKVLNTQILYGGDINRSIQLSTDKGDFFLKYNNNKLYPEMFEKEARGLQLMSSTNEIDIPQVITANNTDDDAYLLLSYIETNHQKAKFWEQFGEQLANMHKHTATQFGLDEDNYIGTLPQSNKQHDSFVDFFIKERLEVQLNIAEQANKINLRQRKSFNTLYKQLPNLIPTEVPALLHGDLWSGNYMVNKKGEPSLIDPAVYYGHREVDLAMTTLFGRFDTAFYEAYHATFPIEKAWKERIAIYNLYPLLVHVNLFGGAYIKEVESILRYYR